VLEAKVHKHELLVLRFVWLFCFCLFLSITFAFNVAIFRGQFYYNWGLYWLFSLLGTCAIAYTQLFLWLALPVPLFMAVTLILLVRGIRPSARSCDVSHHLYTGDERINWPIPPRSEAFGSIL
jgi:hypothetical protein